MSKLAIVISLIQPSQVMAQTSGTHQTAKAGNSQKTKKLDTISLSKTGILNQFQAMMNVPVMQKSFDKVQGLSLRTSIDLQTSEALLRNPLIIPVLPLLREQISQIIKDSIDQNDLTMTPLNPNEPAHKATYNAAYKAMTRLGFNSEKLKTFQFYRAMGPVNAYTQGDIFIVVFDALLDKASYLKIETNKYGEPTVVQKLEKLPAQGVFAHEGGHMKSGHIEQGIMNSALTILLAKVFVGPDAFAGSDPGSYFQDARTMSTKNNGSMWIDLFNTFLLPENTRAEVLNHKQTSNIAPGRAEKFLGAIKNMSSNFDQLTELAPQQSKAYLIDYLEAMLSIAQRAEAPQHTSLILGRMIAALQDGSDIKEQQTFSIKEFMSVFGNLAATISVADEASADGYGNMAVRPEHFVKMDMLFSGTPFQETPQDLPAEMREIQRNVEMIRARTLAFYARNSIDQTNLAVGGVGRDHPAPRFRVLNFMDNATRPEMVSMRNPFLNIVVTRNYLFKQATDAQTELAALQKEFAAAGDKISPDILKGAKVMEKELTETATESTPAAAELTDLIVKDIQNEGFDGKANSRLLNLLQYQLARKNQTLRAFEEFDQVLSQTKDPQLIQLLKSQRANIEGYYTIGDDLLVAVLNAMKAREAASSDKTLLERRMKVIEETLNCKLTPARTQELRDEMFSTMSFSKTKRIGEKGTQITRDAKFQENKSSLRDRYSPKDQTATTNDRSDTGSGDTLTSKRFANPQELIKNCKIWFAN